MKAAAAATAAAASSAHAGPVIPRELAPEAVRLVDLVAKELGGSHLQLLLHEDLEDAMQKFVDGDNAALRCECVPCVLLPAAACIGEK